MDSQIFQTLVPHAEAFIAAAQATHISPILLAAIASRESNIGKSLTGDTGDLVPRSNRYPATLPVTTLATGKVMPADGLGWGRGIMQIDYAAHYGWVREVDWRNPLVNIGYGASVLDDCLRYLAATPKEGRKVHISAAAAKWRGATAAEFTLKDPRPLRGTQLVRSAIASYNTGAGNVLKSVAMGLDPDVTTAHKNYSADVLRRASALSQLYWERKWRKK